MNDTAPISKNFSDFMSNLSSDTTINDYDCLDTGRSKRIVSLDSSAYETYKAYKKKNKGGASLRSSKNEKKRSMSANDEPFDEPSAGASKILFKRLSFENIDILNTPLSSLRSCSEYNHGMPKNFNVERPVETAPKKKSYWRRIKNILGGSFHVERRTSMKCTQDGPSDETRFFLQSLQFDEANLVEGEDYDYGSGKRDSTEVKGPEENIRQTAFMHSRNDSNSSSSSKSFNSFRQNNSGRSRVSSRNSTEPLRRKPLRRTACSSSSVQHIDPGAGATPATQPTWLDESYMAIDYVFGIKVEAYMAKPMEIELMTIRDYQLSPPSQSEMERYPPRNGFSALSNILTFTLRPVLSHSASSFSRIHINEHNGPTLTSLQRVASWRSILTMQEAHSGNSHNAFTGAQTTLGGTPAEDGVSGANLFLGILYDMIQRSPMATAVLGILDAVADRLGAVYRPPEDSSDDFFFDSISLQPFSSSSYLRGMLLSGASSLCFNMYTLAAWSSMTASLGAEHAYLLYWLYFYLLANITVNVIQTPIRTSIHFQCWNTSRAVQNEHAVDVLRNMILGNCWMFNRCLGQVDMFLGVVNLMVTEAYLWVNPREQGVGGDELRTLVVLVCATTLLTFIARVVSASVFSLVLSDPQLVTEARQRGLSKPKIDSLRTFVFSDLKEVNNDCCSICLSEFDIGDMLICLPCDQNKRTGGGGSLRCTPPPPVVHHHPDDSQETPAHSFHAACIREWLKRQNSCPLCQKIV
jgi:hypothetical protein